MISVVNLWSKTLAVCAVGKKPRTTLPICNIYVSIWVYSSMTMYRICVFRANIIMHNTWVSTGRSKRRYISGPTVQSEPVFRWMRVAHLTPVMIICTDMQRSHLRQETMEFDEFYVLWKGHEIQPTQWAMVIKQAPNQRYRVIVDRR